MDQDKKNSLWLAIQYGITIVFSLITLKLNLIHYGNELYGAWILVASLWGFGKALDFGLGTSLVKFVAEFSKKNNSKINSLVTTCFILMLFLGMIILFSIFVIGWLFYFSANKVIATIYYQETLLVFIILGISFYFNYVSIIFKSFFDGLSDFVTSSKINILYAFFILISVIVCSVFNLAVSTLAIFYLISSILNIIVHWIFFRVKYPSIHISVKFFEFFLVKKVFGFSLAIQGAAIFGSLIDPLIKYLIGNFSSIASISVYEIARRFVTAVTGLFNTTFRPILPKASILFNKDDYAVFLYNECAKLSRMGITYSGTVFGIGAIIIPLIIQQIFDSDVAVLIFFILALPESINNFGYAIYNFLIGIDKAFFLVIVQLINIFVIGLSVYAGLVIFGSMLGLLGYGLTVLIVNSLMVVFTRKNTGISIKKYFLNAKAYKLLILLLFLLISVFLIHYDDANLYLVLFSLSSLSLVVFFNDLMIYSSLIFNQIGNKKNG